LQLGVTELTALTWLPRLITTLRATYPGIHLVPEVDLSRSLFNRLLEGTIDIIVIPETFFDPLVSSLRLTEVQNSWMASPELIRRQRTLSLDELGVYTILSQGPGSGSGSYFARWLRSQGIVFERELSSNSLVALVGLTLAGLGVSYLPTACFQPIVKAGQLRIIPTKPLLPPVPYGAMFRNDRPTVFNEGVAQLMLQVCDFATQYRR
jgi:DNA-binding transcriptional LysR family regulator